MSCVGSVLNYQASPYKGSLIIWQVQNVGLKVTGLCFTSTGTNLNCIHWVGDLVRVFLCPCVGSIPLHVVGLTLTWFIWGYKTSTSCTLHSNQLSLFKHSLKQTLGLIRPKQELLGLRLALMNGLVCFCIGKTENCERDQL